MMTKPTFNDDSFFINTMDTCFFVRLGKNIPISREPFVMAGGDVLEHGDGFTRIDEKGSAGNQPILVTPPWVQRYEGTAMIPDDDAWYPNRKMVLFSSFIPNETDKFAFSEDGSKAVGTAEGYYIGYLDHGGSLFHLRSSGSSSVAKCNSIERF